MNIFVLDLDHDINARYHCDKHVVKMITEQTQLLCSSYYFTDELPEGIYRLTHQNHPCAIWARRSLSNWLWLRDSTLALCREYSYRYGRKHACQSIVADLTSPHILDIGLTPFAQAMPEQHRSDNPISAYRAYYNAEKRHLFSWKNRQIPDWILI